MDSARTAQDSSPACGAAHEHAGVVKALLAAGFAIMHQAIIQACCAAGVASSCQEVEQRLTTAELSMPDVLLLQRWLGSCSAAMEAAALLERAN